MSPMPQLVLDGHAKRGMSRPARRRPAGLVIEVPEKNLRGRGKRRLGHQ